MQEYTVRVYKDRTVWYQNGKLHREGGPAIESANGSKHWYKNGQLHREDGPAVEWANGYKCWYLEGLNYTETQWKARVNPNSCDGKMVEIEGKKYQLKEVK